MHGLANPARFLRLARWLTPLLLLAGIVLAGSALAWGLFVVPPERLQGDTVRILFLHVPAAWLGMGGWMAIAAASFAELVWRHPLAAVAARAAAVPGAVFTAICLVTGSLWGRPAWGVWWVWDGRLTSMLVLLFLYFAWMALADAAQRDGGGQSRAPAIFGLVGVVNIPIIKFSVDWWNTLHQPASVFKTSGPAIYSSMLWPLLIMAVGFTFLFTTLHLMSIRNEILRRRIRRLSMLAASKGETGLAPRQPVEARP